MLHNLARRLGKIEKDIGKDKDKSVWLRVPRSWVGLDGNPEELVDSGLSDFNRRYGSL